MSEQNTFKFGNLQYDTNKLARYLHDNAERWIDASGYKGKDGLQVRQSINNMILQITDGQSNELNYAGLLHNFANNAKDKHFLGIKTGLTLDSNGIAIAYLNDAISNLGDVTQTPYDTNGWEKEFSNMFYGGQFTGTEPLILAFIDKDAVGDDGIRGTQNRYKAFGDFLDYWATNLPQDLSYNHLGGYDVYKNKIIDNAARVRNGDTSGLIELGISPEKINALFTTGTTTPSETKATGLEAKLEALRQRWNEMGISPEKLAEYEQYIKQHPDAFGLTLDEEMEKYILADKWQTYASLHYDPNFSDFSLNLLGGSPFSPEYYEGKTIEGKKYPGVVSIETSQGKDFFAKYKTALSNWNPISWDYKTKRRIFASIYYNYKLNPNLYTPINGTDEIYINKLINYDNGTAWKVNLKTGAMTKVNVATDTNLARMMFDKWQKENSPKKWTMEFRAGGIISFLDGGALAREFDAKLDSKVNAWLKDEAKETGRDIDLTREGQKSFDLSNLNTALKLRLATLALDIISIPVAYAGPYGVAASGTLGLTGTATDLAADLMDPSVSTANTLKNAAYGLGFAAVGMIPGANELKIGKIWNGIRKFWPLILSGVSAYGLATNPRVQKTVRKITNNVHKDENPDFTIDDWKNLASIFRVIAFSNLAAKSTYNTYRNAESVSVPISSEDVGKIKLVGGKSAPIKRSQYDEIIGAWKKGTIKTKSTRLKNALSKFEEILSTMTPEEKAVFGENPKLSFNNALGSGERALPFEFEQAKNTDLPAALRFYSENNVKSPLSRIFNDNYQVANGAPYWNFGNPIRLVNTLKALKSREAANTPAEEGIVPAAEEASTPAAEEEISVPAAEETSEVAKGTPTPTEEAVPTPTPETTSGTTPAPTFESAPTADNEPVVIPTPKPTPAPTVRRVNINNFHRLKALREKVAADTSTLNKILRALADNYVANGFTRAEAWERAKVQAPIYAQQLRILHHKTGALKTQRLNEKLLHLINRDFSVNNRNKLLTDKQLQSLYKNLSKKVAIQDMFNATAFLEDLAKVNGITRAKRMLKNPTFLEASRSLYKFKDGGIVKYEGGGVSGIGQNGSWYGTVGELTWNEILKRLKDNPEYYLVINLAQTEHAKLRDAAQGHWDRNLAYLGTDNSVSSYLTKYNNGQWNEIAIRPNYSTRYDFSGGKSRADHRTSGDKPETWTADNLYAGVTDDRRLLGRDDEYTPEILQLKNNILKDYNLLLYKDTDNYYKLKQLEPVKEPSPGGMEATEDDVWGDPYYTDKKNNGLNLSKLLYSINPFIPLKIAGALHANKQMVDNAKRKKYVLESYTPVTHTEKADKSTYDARLALLELLRHSGENIARNTNGSLNATASLLAVENQIQNGLTSARADYNKSVNDEAAISEKYNITNSSNQDTMRNKNMGTAVAKFNHDIDVENGANPWTNVWLYVAAEGEKDFKLAKAEHKANLISQLTLEALAHEKQALQGLYDAYNLSPTQDNYNKLMVAMRNYEASNQALEDKYKIYEAKGIDTSGLRNIKTVGWNTAAYRNKNGGKLVNKDDGPVKTRTKDLDRFLKLVKAMLDLHDKKLSRLDNATLLELKKMLG